MGLLNTHTPRQRTFEMGEALFGRGEVLDELMLIESGTAKALEKVGPRWRLLAHCRGGHWLGLTTLLGGGRKRAGERKVEAIDGVKVLSFPMGAARALLAEREDFRRFVIQQRRVRFEAHARLRSLIGQNALLRLLEPEDWDLLIQLGAWRRYDGEEGSPWMSAGAPGRRVALLISGSAQLHLPSGGFVASHVPGALVGFEHLALPEELEAGVRADTDDKPNPMGAQEPPRETHVYLEKGAELIEFDWRAFRWMMYEKKHIWSQVCDFLRPGCVSPPQEPAQIFAFFSQAAGNGTSTLAHGAAVALARSLADEGATEAPTVCLIDLQNPGRLLSDGSRARPSDRERGMFNSQIFEGDLVDGLEDNFFYWSTVREVGHKARIQMAWCEGACQTHTDSLIKLIRQQGKMRYILVAFDYKAVQRDEHLDNQEARRLVDCLGRMGASVVWVTDDPLADYDATDDRPETLIRAERLNEACEKRESERARRTRTDWFREASDILEQSQQSHGRLAGTIDRILAEAIGLSADPEEVEQAPVRHVLRVPEDVDGIGLFGKGRFDDLFGGYRDEQGQLRPPAPLGRCFERLARMIQGRTVGLALGGGGAWGFTQIALIRELLSEGLPIDYISGTSFGSLVAGLFAAGGDDALEALLRWSGDGAPGLGWPHHAVQTLMASRLTRKVGRAVWRSHHFEQLVDGIIEEVVGKAVPLSLTRVPFEPIGASMATGQPVVIRRGTVGFGVRSASCLPPLFPALWMPTDRLIDGAVVANVPAQNVRRLGADFVVACNVIPCNPRGLGNFESRDKEARERFAAMRDSLSEVRARIEPQRGTQKADAEDRGGAPQGVGAVDRTWAALRARMEEALQVIKEATTLRLHDTQHGFYLMGWSAGKDQSLLEAQVIVDMHPDRYESHQFWRGREIAGEYKAHLRPPGEDSLARRVVKLWKDRDSWARPTIHETIGRDRDH